jgi:hypothetical protein
MKKIFLSLPYYTDWRQDAFQTFMVPRNKKFCELHGYKYIEISHKIAPPVQIFNRNIPFSNNIMFFRWKILKDAIEAGKLNEGDIINMYDCDVFIVQPQLKFETSKSFTYVIDSGNTHCMGIFSLKVNQFTKKLIDCMLSQTFFDKLYNYPLYHEYHKTSVPFYECDQHAFYHFAGIKPHSWTSFLDLPNYGFHSYITPGTCFTLDELKDNIEILGPEWNTTHLVEETGDNGSPNWFDIVRTTKDKVINRHFAGGQPWLCKEWKDYSKKYESTI